MMEEEVPLPPPTETVKRLWEAFRPAAARLTADDDIAASFEPEIEEE